MDFHLHRGEHAGLGTPVLGTYRDFDTALRARDDDVIAQLSHRPSPPREIAYLVIGPGLAGPQTPHLITTFAGVAHGHPNPAAEVAAIELWLRQVHNRQQLFGEQGTIAHQPHALKGAPAHKMS